MKVFDEITISKIIELHQKKLSISAIARETGLSRPTVRTKIEEYRKGTLHIPGRAETRKTVFVPEQVLYYEVRPSILKDLLSLDTTKEGIDIMFAQVIADIKRVFGVKIDKKVIDGTGLEVLESLRIEREKTVEKLSGYVGDGPVETTKEIEKEVAVFDTLIERLGRCYRVNRDRIEQKKILLDIYDPRTYTQKDLRVILTAVAQLAGELIPTEKHETFFRAISEIASLHELEQVQISSPERKLLP